MAGSWLMASVYIERMKQTSSATCGRYFHSSLNHMPHLPWRANLYLEGAMGKRAWPEVMVVRRWPIRTLLGKSLSYHSPMRGL